MGGEPFDPKVFERVAPEDAHGEIDHIKSTDVRRTVAIPEGRWIDVRAGQTHAQGVVPNPDYPGVLMDAEDPTKVICWHLSRKVFYCVRRGIRPDQVVIDPETGAGWCPTCFSQKKRLDKKEKRKKNK